MIVRQTIRKLLLMILHGLPNESLKDFLVEVATIRVKSQAPAEGLRFLFGVEAALSPVQGKLAVAYGVGLHTKHRHMRYHNFFVNRIQARERVLDIGCGIGAVAYDVAERAKAYVVGIDRNADKIALARQRYMHPRVGYRVGDALQDLPSEHFDVVILSNVLEHSSDRLQFLERVQQAASPSRFLIRVPLFERDWRVPLKQELGVEWRLDATHETEYTLESFAEEMSAAGLSITHQEVRWGEIWAEATN